jgi:hypothetical protein
LCLHSEKASPPPKWLGAEVIAGKSVKMRPGSAQDGRFDFQNLKNLKVSHKSPKIQNTSNMPFYP